MFYAFLLWELEIYLLISLNELFVKYVLLHVTDKRVLNGTRGFSDALPEHSNVTAAVYTHVPCLLLPK